MSTTHTTKVRSRDIGFTKHPNSEAFDTHNGKPAYLVMVDGEAIGVVWQWKAASRHQNAWHLSDDVDEGTNPCVAHDRREAAFRLANPRPVR